MVARHIGSSGGNRFFQQTQVDRDTEFAEHFLSPPSVFSVPLMKIPISGKIPRSYGPPPLQKGAIGGFLGVGPDPLRLIFMRGVVRVVDELLRGESNLSPIHSSDANAMRLQSRAEAGSTPR